MLCTTPLSFRVVAGLAGAASEAILTNQRLLDVVHGRSRGDWSRVLEVMQGDRHGLSLEHLADQATQLIRARWGLVAALAEVLMARGSLTYAEVRRILAMRIPPHRGDKARQTIRQADSDQRAVL